MFINYIKIELNIYLNDDKGLKWGQFVSSVLKWMVIDCSGLFDRGTSRNRKKSVCETYLNHVHAHSIASGLILCV